MSHSKSKLITVYTPTYNRAYILSQAYQSLKKQTSKDFKWLVIDDGSSDDTETMVATWIEENEFEIIYVKKNNGGMHTAQNVAWGMLNTELCVCLDSDDNFTPQAILTIKEAWKQVPDNGNVAGIIADQIKRTDKSVIGKSFPGNLSRATFHDIYYKYNVTGDKVLIYRSALLKDKKIPVFEGEKYVGMDVALLPIDLPLIIIHETFYEKEYLPDGITQNILQVFKKNINGYLFYQNFKIDNIHNYTIKLKSAIHLIALSLYSGRNPYKQTSSFSSRIWITLMMPFGFLWYLIFKIRVD